MGKKEFDYYIFIDYSINLIGYLIIEKKNIKSIISKISKLRHYREVSNKEGYIKSLKSAFEKNNLLDSVYLYKTKKMINTLEIYADIADFISSNKEANIFISLDDNQTSNFERLVKDINGERVLVVKEGKLKKDSVEQKLSLIIDNLLNIERLKGGTNE